MKLKTKTGEMLVLDEEQTAWKGESAKSDTSITVSEADELLEKGDLEMVAEESEIQESISEAEEPKAIPFKKKKKKVDGSGEVDVVEDEEEDDDDDEKKEDKTSKKAKATEEEDGDEADEDEDDEVEETKDAKSKKVATK